MCRFTLGILGEEIRGLSMETFQENLEHQKRGKATDRSYRAEDGLARPPVGQRSRRRDNEVFRSNGPGNGPRDSGSAARPRPSAARRRAHEGRRTVLVRRRTKDGELVEHVVVRRRTAERVRGRQREREEEGEGARHNNC